MIDVDIRPLPKTLIAQAVDMALEETTRNPYFAWVECPTVELSIIPTRNNDGIVFIEVEGTLNALENFVTHLAILMSGDALADTEGYPTVVETSSLTETMLVIRHNITYNATDKRFSIWLDLL